MNAKYVAIFTLAAGLIAGSLFVAQAQSEGLTLVTNDGRIAAYDVPVLW